MLTTPGASVGAGAGLSGRRGDTSSTVSRKGRSSLNAERSGSGASGWLASLGGFSFVPSLRCSAGETPELPQRTDCRSSTGLRKEGRTSLLERSDSDGSLPPERSLMMRSNSTSAAFDAWKVFMGLAASAGPACGYASNLC